MVWHGNYRDCRKVVQGSRYRFQCQDFCRVAVQPSQTPLHPCLPGCLGLACPKKRPRQFNLETYLN